MSFNLNEEIIDGHLVTKETKKLWAVEMDLAKKLLEVCQKYNLKVWADGGTLLGAVRHKGFIPWDDDMDFAMMRDDYNKLIEIGPQEFKDPYFFQSFYTDNTWGGMAKIRRSDTAMIDETYDQMKDRNSGVFIDVFVMDGIPSSEVEFKKEYHQIEWKRRLLTRYGVYRPDFKGLKAILRTLYVWGYFLFHDYKKEQQKIVNLLSSNKIEDCEYCALIDFYAGEHVSFSKIHRKKCAWYNDTTELPFYDLKIPVPKDYHKVLTNVFGNYMIPIKGKQFHTIIAVDCNRSYKDLFSREKNN